MKYFLIISMILALSSCSYSTYGIRTIDANTATISSFGGEYTGGQNYAKACFMIGAADYTKMKGAKYFVILSQDMSVDTSVSSSSTPIGTYSNGMPMVVTSSTSMSDFYKEGVVRVFNDKPESDYVLSYEAEQVLRRYHPNDKSKCRTGN